MSKEKKCEKLPIVAGRPFPHSKRLLPLVLKEREREKRVKMREEGPNKKIQVNKGESGGKNTIRGAKGTDPSVLKGGKREKRDVSIKILFFFSLPLLERKWPFVHFLKLPCRANWNLVFHGSD